jgi:large-conductance mechanosensitive channel
MEILNPDWGMVIWSILSFLVLIFIIRLIVKYLNRK